MEPSKLPYSRLQLTVLIAEPHEIDRAGMEAWLSVPDIKVVGVATTAAETLALARQPNPNLVLTELRFDDLDGLTLIRRIKKSRPQQRILIFSAYDNPRYLAGAKALGVEGYRNKGCTRDELLSAVRMAATDIPCWPEYELQQIATTLASPPGIETIETSLSRRESDILRQISSGLSNLAVARNLGHSRGLIMSDIKKVLRKLGVEDRTQATLWALHNGLL